MNWSKVVFEIRKKNRLKVKTMTGSKELKTIKIKITNRHYPSGE